MSKEKHLHKSEHDHKEEPKEVVSAEVEHTATETEDVQNKNNPFKSMWVWSLAHKKISIPAAIVLVLAVLAAIPFTRFAIAGLFLKQNFSVQVVDSETGKPVSSATVTLNDQSAETDGEGSVTIHTKVGYATLTIEKKYYESTSEKVTVPIAKQKSATVADLHATGRAVPVTVLNKISKEPLANITVRSADSDAVTDDEGKATMVVPTDKSEVDIMLTGDGFNETSVKLMVTTDENPANTFEMTPSGKVYFLSNASGKIDLVKSNLDGTARQTVLAGTGKEDRNNTILLASSDWKYIGLLSQRDGGEYPKLFLLETGSDKLTTMDEGEATFNLYGWSGDRLIYRVHRAKVKSWEDGQYALKSYDAAAKKITKLDETDGEGNQNNSATESIDEVYIIGKDVVYAKDWSGWGNSIQGKRAAMLKVGADGSDKTVLKAYPPYPEGSTYLEVRSAEFGELYIRYSVEENDTWKSKVDEYVDGKVTATNMTENEFNNKAYPKYAVSPSGNKTLWSEDRDGKNALFVGDGKGENGREIGRSDEYTVYGWFTDNYVLVTKKGSEMFILASDGSGSTLDKALKISDYYKPQYYYNRGFGYGYGG